ncbi:MAG TPA: MAPEG family protein [Burkholderiales bacterium]|nr:MAPEG family protein [Burkholderiales bacterium]
MNTAIILPAIALVLLTAVVWVRLYVERIRELRQRRIDPQSLATSVLGGQTLQRVQASDNFKNLFEVPVLFYALCAVLASTHYVSPFFVIGAWLYVALRYIHSFIHLTYNRVTHRFAVYVLSTVTLLVLWGVLGVQVLFLRVAA